MVHDWNEVALFAYQSWAVSFCIMQNVRTRTTKENLPSWQQNVQGSDNFIQILNLWTQFCPAKFGSDELGESVLRSFSPVAYTKYSNLYILRYHFKSRLHPLKTQIQYINTKIQLPILVSMHYLIENVNMLKSDEFVHKQEKDMKLQLNYKYQLFAI